jgi:hypothetical protein
MGVWSEQCKRKIVDNCQKTVDKPRGLWKNRSIVRIWYPHIWPPLYQQSKIWIVKNGPRQAEKPAAFSLDSFPQPWRMLLPKQAQVLGLSDCFAHQ